MRSNVKSKTFEDHKEYLYDIVKLKLFFLWHWQKMHLDEKFEFTLRERVDIYRKTDINPEGMNPHKTHFEDPRWIELENRLLELFKKTVNDSNSDVFEHKGIEILKPTIDARVKRDYEERPYVLDYNCGSLKFDSPGKENPTRVGFHIANAIQPHSIFEDPQYLPNCLISLMKQSEKLGADSLATGTWLNSHPLWLENFPQEWFDNMGPVSADVNWNFSYWGQFINARGTFNQKLGKFLRETGNFPFTHHSSWCSFESLKRHLTDKGFYHE